MAGPKAQSSAKIPVYQDWYKHSTLKRTTWDGKMGISVVTSLDKGLARLALAPSQVLEALPNSEEG